MELLKKLFRFAGEVDKKTELALNILGWVLLIFIWWLVCELKWIKPTILPSPIDVIICFKTLFHGTTPAVQYRVLNFN